MPDDDFLDSVVEGTSKPGISHVNRVVFYVSAFFVILASASIFAIMLRLVNPYFSESIISVLLLFFTAAIIIILMIGVLRFLTRSLLQVEKDRTEIVKERAKQLYLERLIEFFRGGRKPPTLSEGEQSLFLDKERMPLLSRPSDSIDSVE